jgi:hypothetical protein
LGVWHVWCACLQSACFGSSDGDGWLLAERHDGGWQIRETGENGCLPTRYNYNIHKALGLSPFESSQHPQVLV